MPPKDNLGSIILQSEYNFAFSVWTPLDGLTALVRCQQPLSAMLYMLNDQVGKLTGTW